MLNSHESLTDSHYHETSVLKKVTGGLKILKTVGRQCSHKKPFDATVMGGWVLKKNSKNKIGSWREFLAGIYQALIDFVTQF